MSYQILSALQAALKTRGELTTRHNQCCLALPFACHSDCGTSHGQVYLTVEQEQLRLYHEGLRHDDYRNWHRAGQLSLADPDSLREPQFVALLARGIQSLLGGDARRGPVRVARWWLWRMGDDYVPSCRQFPSTIGFSRTSAGGIGTVGHSTLEWSQFLDTVQGYELVVDVRSHPDSRWPQFQGHRMQQQLGDRYQWWPGLGGWTGLHLHLAEQYAPHGVDLAVYAKGKFPKQRIAAQSDQAGDGTPAWTNQGLYDYSVFMGTDEFLQAAQRLLDESRRRPVVIMCCEAQYYRCHRSMIADYLWWRGADCRHLTGRPTKTKGTQVSQKWHCAALQNRLDRYPPRVVECWNQFRRREAPACAT